MNTRALIIPSLIVALAALASYAKAERPMAPKHDIRIKHSHPQTNGLDWHVDKHHEAVEPSGDTVTWRNKEGLTFWIVVRQTDAQWTPTGTNVFEKVTTAPFSDGSYWSMQSQPDGSDQVVTLQIQALGSPDHTIPVQYYILTDGTDLTAANKSAEAKAQGKKRVHAIPYYFYMADAMVVWE